ncbi:hydrogen peroxide-inducible genes activator [Hyphococcus flavus]|uniref:Hydrogen peroxide-inducible genes activator n=1 Tax=Hyphococcus flavus TaxID=1866326 RepID=A0AAE9ZE40_9PROT|nr:hydrogen peroxide-inducible genes activator [Hyphococcus flavus]WDI33184.1 hydrogen peroxide-inducible genes activator [Hyphococcus flavus]
MTPLPTLRQLQFFMALVRRESFSKAAEDCLVSQSTLSSAIKEMEALMAQQLVDRSTRAFALTPAGEEVAKRAPALLAGAEDLVRSASGRNPLEGPFTLGIIPTIAPFMLPRAAKALKKAYPKLQLYLREDLTATLAERLAAGLIDAAILAFPYDLPGLDSFEFSDDPFWFACANDHPLADKKSLRRDDIKGCELLLLEDGHCLREHAIDACELRDRDAAASFGGTSLFTLAQMAKSGLGATLLPDMAVREGLAKSTGLKVIPFTKPVPSRKIGIAWRRGSGRREEAEALAETIKTALN